MSLFERVQAGDVAAVLRALEGGADANELGPAGRTLLIEAAVAGNAELVRVLLAHGAEPFLKDGEGESAIMKAAAYGHRKVVELLWTKASEDERQTAEAYLRAAGKTHGPERTDEPSELQREVADLGARAADFFGYQDPKRRLERAQRAEKPAKKR